ncbi:MAG: NCS2 family permease, partial [Oscillospiraceae bacterium]
MVDFAQWRNPDADMQLICGALVAFIGLIIMGVLHARRVKGSIFIGIVASTVIGIPLGITSVGNISFNIGEKFSDFMEVSFMNMDFAGLFSGDNLVETIFTVTMLVISFSLVNMFDSIGTLLGAAKQSGMIDENGEVINMKQALMSDAISTAAGAMLGTSTVTTVVESSAGIAEGGRTGLTSLVTSLLFLAAIIFAPIVGIVPGAATAPALIFVGILMMSNVKDVDFSEMTEALPSFCTIIFMPFTYSIANGVAMGLITFCLMKLFSGKVKEIKLLTAIVALVFIARYAFMTLG